MKRNPQSGMALVLTLAMLALITAMVVEFAYGVYVNMSFLDNYKTSTRLSHVASSGVTLASKFITDAVSRLSYTYPSHVEMPEADPFTTGIEGAKADAGGGEGGEGTAEKVSVRIEDESARFNVNTVIFPNGLLNEAAYNSLRRLLRSIELDEGIADRLADWIDADGLPRTQGSELDVRNAPFESVDEIVLVPGIDRDTYDKLKPYMTVYGNGLININGAEAPVLMSLSEAVDAELAQRVIDRRDIAPFKVKGELNNLAGFESMLNLPITVKAGVFRVFSIAASESGIKRSVECVLDSGGSVIYWREF